MNEKVLLDECVPRRFKFLLDGFAVRHAKDPEVKLNGIFDTNVLKKAVQKEFGFDVVVTTEREIHQQIGDEKQYKLGIVVVNLDIGVKPRLENIAPLASKVKEAIKQVQKGQMLHIHSSGLIEKVTYKQLLERDLARKEGKQERGIEKRQEYEGWQSQRPEGKTVKEWGQEFGKKKQEEHRQQIAEKEQLRQQIQKR